MSAEDFLPNLLLVIQHSTLDRATSLHALGFLLQNLRGEGDPLYQVERNSCDCWAQGREGFMGREEEEDSYQESDYLCPLLYLSLIHISEPTRLSLVSRMPSSA